MSLFYIKGNQATNIPPASFVDRNIPEKQIQEIIAANLNILGEDLLLISEQYFGWEDSRKHLDILALDKSGNLVVIELKRDDKGFHMDLQAIRYASMVSQMSLTEIYSAYSKKHNCSEDKAKEKITTWLQDSLENDEELLQDVRIILVNQDFGKELTSCVLWLLDKNIDISCIRITPYQVNGEILWDIDKIIPLKEADDYRKNIRKQQAQIEEQKKSQKDYTKYRFFEQRNLPKNRLVLEIIKKYVNDNPQISFEGLHNKFPDNLQGSLGVIEKIENIKDGRRYFMNESLKLGDNSTIAVCSGWSIHNLEKILEHIQAIGLNYDISKDEE